MAILNGFMERLRQALIAGFLAVLMMITGLSTSAQAAPANPEDRGSDVTRASDTTYKGRQVMQDDSNRVNPATIKKIQREAEDLGDSPDRPIGQTGLKNIRKLGENIPETFDLNVRQKGEIYAPKGSDARETLDAAKNAVERTVDDLRN